MKKSGLAPVLTSAIMTFAVILSGCTSNGTTPPTTPVSSVAPPPTSQDITNPAEIVAALKQAAAGIESYRVDVTGNTTMDNHGVVKTLFTSGIALVDVGLDRAYFDTAIVDTTVGGTMTQRTETYWFDGWVYSFKDPNFSSGSTSGLWYKYARPDGDAASFIYSTKALMAAVEKAPVTITGSERANGVECYKLSVGGDYPELLYGELSAATGVDLAVWVTKTDFRLAMVSIAFKLPSEGLSIEYRYSATYSQFNQVSVSLPVPALRAVEFPPPPTLLPADQTQAKIQDVILSARIAAANLVSYTAMSIMTINDPKSLVTTYSLGKADLAKQVFYLDERYAQSGILRTRTEYYFLSDAVCEHRDYASGTILPSVWYKRPVTAGTVPAFASDAERVLDMMLSANISLGDGVTSDTECYTLRVLSNYSAFLPADQGSLSDVRCTVYVAKDTSRILLISINYTATSGGAVTTYNGGIYFTDFDKTVVNVPPEALNAQPPPSPPPPATPPAS
jgi:hypothetical protein